MLGVTSVYKTNILRHGFVKDDLSNCGLNNFGTFHTVNISAYAHIGHRLQRKLAHLIGQNRLVRRRECTVQHRFFIVDNRKIIRTDDHILRGHHHRAAVGRL